MKLKLLRKNTTLKADGKELVFKDGFLEVKKITKGIQALIDDGYLEKIEEKNNGNAINK